jgi:uncharacterized protein YjbI with pentapeptide repeats
MQSGLMIRTPDLPGLIMVGDKPLRKGGAKMATQETVQLKQINQRWEITESCLSGSTFTDVNRSNAAFDDVNFSGATFQNANLSGWRVRDVSLSGLQITQADLRGASIVDCLTEGMTIDGIAVADLFAAYRSAHPATDTNEKIP